MEWAEKKSQGAARGKNRKRVLGLVTAALLATLLWCGMAWARDLISPAPKEASDPPEETGKTHLYFTDKNNRFLIAEERSLNRGVTEESYGRAIIEALIKGPQSEMMRTLPEKTKLRAFYLSGDHTAYVDFSQEIGDHHPGGVQMERITLYSIVNSLVLNMPGIKHVRILVKGKTRDTLSGHLDLTFPFKAELLLIR